MKAETLRELLGLEGKVALVAGGAGGIGSAVVRILLDAGAAVVASDLPGRPVPDGAAAVACDLRSPSEIGRLVSRVASDHGRLDVLVHSAGVTRDSVLWKMEESAWTEVLAVNLESAFHLLKAAAPLLRRTGNGSVVLIASINGERGKFGQANYAASKAGLMALGKTAAAELGRFGVRVNSVAPGFIETPMTAGLPGAARGRAEAETLLGRLGQPEDVARVVLFLSAPLSRHVTGQVIRVDGGQLTA
jgi:NAD(P)-dependent dehydrogenase (short-subunit alcohol dehydrogenase family)